MATTHRLPLVALALLVVMGTIAESYAVSVGADISRSSSQLWYFCFSYCVAWWVELDRRAKGISAPFEYAAFVFFAWPILAPYYLFQSRRWRGLALGIGLFVLVYVPYLTAVGVYYLLGGE